MVQPSSQNVLEQSFKLIVKSGLDPFCRPFLEKVEEYVFPSYGEVRRVTKNGALRWRLTKWVMVATSLIDKHVGLEELVDGIWRIYFKQKVLGYFDEIKLRIMDELG